MVSHACRQRLTQPLPAGVKLPELMKEFYQCINMNKEEMEAWLESEESSKAAQDHPDDRKLARRVIELLDKRGRHGKDQLSPDTFYEADWEQMYQITEYIKCHLEDLRQARNFPECLPCYHLKNVGHDPVKDFEV